MQCPWVPPCTTPSLTRRSLKPRKPMLRVVVSEPAANRRRSADYQRPAAAEPPAVEGGGRERERALRTRDLRSGGAYVVGGQDNAWRSRAPGPHAHGNAARQVLDGLRTEVWGQQKQSNDPRNQH